MTIAVMLDFEGENLSNRDGIFLYVYHLMNAWLEYCENIYIEVWVFNHSRKEAERFLEDLRKRYGSRIVVCSDFGYTRKNRVRYFCDHRMQIILSHTARLLRVCSMKSLEKAVMHKAEVYGKKSEEAKSDFEGCFQSESKAEVCYVPFVTLGKALKCNRPVVLQVHDLFTFQFFYLFMKESNPPALYCKYNRRVKRLLTQYAKKGTIFVSSSEYTVRNQIQKYIPAIKEEQCEVILFPPLLSQFDGDNLPDKKSFKDRFKIPERYIAFPSQNRPNKNMILLLKALKKVNDRGYSLKLVTTGRMQDVRATQKFCRNNGSLVIEIGDLSEKDLFCLYKYSDMVVCPNLIEGMGISGQALEALKIGGIPVIHAKTLGIEGLLNRIGLTWETADLNWVDVSDPESLSNEIIEVLKNPEWCIRKQSHIMDAFNFVKWEDVASRYLNIFERIVNG